MTISVPPPQGDAHHQRVLHDNLQAAARNTAREGAQRRVELYPGRWTRRDWAHVSLFATVGALVVALVPGLSHAMRDDQTGAHAQVTMALALPPLTAAQRNAQDSFTPADGAEGETFTAGPDDVVDAEIVDDENDK